VVLSCWEYLGSGYLNPGEVRGRRLSTVAGDSLRRSVVALEQKFRLDRPISGTALKMVSKSLRFGALLVVGVLAFLVGGCGSKKKAAEDPVATAMKTPGVRTVVIPKQRNAVTVVVTACSVAAVQQSGAKRKPPGSNEIVVPRGTLTQTVAVPPCPEKPTQAVANTVLVTPGGAGSTQQQGSTPQNQLVLPSNSNVTTIIVPPCTTSSGGSSTSSEGTKSQAFKAPTKTKSVTAPPCTAPPPMPSS
jgi:hypothetical protein